MRTTMKRHCELHSILRISFLILFAFGFVYLAKAQQYVGLDIRMPKIEKVITITADEVNLRKAPSAASPKRMQWCEYETDNCCYVWSDQKKYRGTYPAGVSKGENFIVVDETDEWYGIVCEQQMKCYVSKKFAKQVELQPITPEMLAKAGDYGFDNTQKPGVTKGFYRGYAMIDANGYETEGVMFGRIVDGVLVFNHRISYGGIHNNDNIKRLSVEVEKEGAECTRMDIKYGSAVANIIKPTDVDPDFEYEGIKMLDMEKLTTDEFAALLSKSGYKKGMTSNYGEIYVCIDGNIVRLTDYDLTDKMFSDNVVTVPANQ